jgi:hypothetical protein
LSLTPGTRSGIIQDAAYQRLITELGPIESELLLIIEEQRRAEEEQASRDVLRSIQRALREALLTLPAEEYDWFEVRDDQGKKPKSSSISNVNEQTPELRPIEEQSGALHEENGGQKQFFEFPGPLFSVRISPASSVVSVGGTKNFRAIARDRSNRLVEDQVSFCWEVLEGGGHFADPNAEIVTFHAPAEPGLTRVKVVARQGEIECPAEALVTVTQSLVPEISDKGGTKQGMPSYTFEKAVGELWRSRYSTEQNVIVINNGHRDFVFASRNKALKLRYISRLFAKELVLKNFPGVDPAECLERLIELSLYTEENLK